MAKNGKNIKVNNFENLYFEYYTYLCRRIYRFVKDEEIANDIVQDVFLKYWQKFQASPADRHELRIDESPKAYLKRACINQALNYLKETKRRKDRESNYFEEIHQSAYISERPDMKYSADETSINIQQAIDQLPPACRNSFLLSRHEQKSYKEIAKLLDISVNTVEKHIGKALNILRKILI